MKSRLHAILACLALTAALLLAQPPGDDWKATKAANEFAVLTPEEERASFLLADGLVAECVASEPLVQEPVLAVWDGDGAMYVAEMRSYMQDEAGTGTKTLRNGRIVRLTSSKGDGIMDHATVFVDGLNLPRAILPLAGGIAVTETDSTSVWSYRDTKGDGVADEKVLLFKGREGDPNHSVEHQDSGLDWNLDNWIYVTYGRERYRFTDGKWQAEPTLGIWTQWGLTHDDTGRVFFTENSTPALGYELPRHYWSLIQKRTGERPHDGEPVGLGLPWDPSFLTAKNLCPRDDRGGKTPPRKTFTSLCGQSIFRGTALSPEARGDYFFCDPTIHVVRRARIENRNGKLNFTSAYGDEEFLVSPDIYFRPVNTATGPDGCLYVVDMYRGIIQDAPWLDPGPRKFIRDSGLAAVHQRGRIWRIRAKDAAPGPAPKMLGETTSALVRHLENANGWWRDTAQRLILLRADRESVAPELAAMARTHDQPLARLHALWTLEGMNRADLACLQASWKDTDPRVRAAAIRIAELLLAKNDPATIDGVTALAPTERDPEVAKQLILSLGSSTDARVIPAIDALTERFLAHEGVFLAATVVSWKKPTPFLARIQSGEALNAIADPGARAEVVARWTKGLAQWNRGLKLPPTMPAEQRGLVTRGEETYFQICVSCHGPDGKGTSLPGRQQLLAPALAGSARVRGPAAGFIPVLINGLLGPIDGQTYEGAMMVPATALGITRDDRLAEVLSYLRYAWGNEASPVTKDDVARIRKQHAARQAPWSDEELKAQATQP